MSDNVKTKGYKTTEFWALVGTTAVALVNQSGVFKFTIPADVIQNVFNAAMAYIGSRSIYKAAAAFAAGKIQPVKNEDLNQ